MKIMDKFLTIFEYGYFLLFFLSLFILWKKQNLFFYYIIGSLFNKILNLILKNIIKQPRPSDDEETFRLALSTDKSFLFKNGILYDIYGMPSDHAQSCFFSTIFIYLSTRQNNILFVYLLISILTLVQRVVFNFHTVLQVLVGVVVGSFVGYVMYRVAREHIKGKITPKIDDFGPL
jgi:membrane-associated phospholipid phosphatase